VISTFSFSYPWWYSFFCVIAGLVYAGVMYYKEQKFAEMTPWFKRLLAFLRALSVALICFLLLSPFIKMIKEDVKQPLVIMASDASSSIKDGESKENISSYLSKWNGLAEKIKVKYDVRMMTFGAATAENGAPDSMVESTTNFAQLFQHIEDNYSDQNLGAIILGSDGIYNEGNNPLYMDPKIVAPVYTVAIGDTMQKKDLYIPSILHNKIVYLNDKFGIQVDVAAYNSAGSRTTLTLEKISGGAVQKISEAVIDINSNNFYTTKNLTIDATSVGVVRYRVRLSEIAGEFNRVNNKKEFFIEVLDARQKILICANAPHPDLGAIQAIMTANKNYDAEIVFASDFNGNVSGYNLAVLHNLPSNERDATTIITNLKKNNIPTIFFVGMQTSLPKFNLAQQVISISGNSRNKEDITPDLNPTFNQFITSDALKNMLKAFPPLTAPFGNYTTTGTTSVYLNQNIKKVKTTYPLIAFSEQNGVKQAVFVGEGIWRWRMFDHLQHKNYDLINELVNKKVQLTSIKSDKRKFRANTAKNVFKDSEAILLDAQLYNDSYEMVNDAEVKLVIKDEKGKEYSYQFSKTQNYYTLNAGSFPDGIYTYVATTNYNGKALSANGRFNVESPQLEQYDLTARHGLLKSISQKYGGSQFYIKNMENIADSLLANKNVKPVMFQTNTTKSIINLRWIFGLLLLLLGGEWFLRRYFGSY
jgi:hypothetical protein